MRATEFIHFLNLQRVSKDELSQFSHLTISDGAILTRKEYKKNAKKESKRKESK
tara:strand:- start:248 stop:409 length:162 start_codon:yes stop_codon:yes gene_type:complete